MAGLLAQGFNSLPTNQLTNKLTEPTKQINKCIGLKCLAGTASTQHAASDPWGPWGEKRHLPARCHSQERGLETCQVWFLFRYAEYNYRPS